MVFEPSGSDATSRAVLDTLARLVPGKPVRYVVATHFHDDHAGGVRAYMNAGATVVTTPAYVSFFQRVARRAGTLGAPEQPLEGARIETVQGGRRVFEDATRRVELLDIGRNPHTDEMLVAWLPSERIIFQGDLWNPPWGDVGVRRRGNATTRYFVEWLRRSRLQVETVVGVHGPIQSRAELDAAVSP
jgi:glyoxylase-like metal-dependent hydrolase (beta-lactamase superfamily II)